MLGLKHPFYLQFINENTIICQDLRVNEWYMRHLPHSVSASEIELLVLQISYFQDKVLELHLLRNLCVPYYESQKWAGPIRLHNFERPVFPLPTRREAKTLFLFIWKMSFVFLVPWKLLFCFQFSFVHSKINVEPDLPYNW